MKWIKKWEPVVDKKGRQMCVHSVKFHEYWYSIVVHHRTIFFVLRQKFSPRIVFPFVKLSMENHLQKIMSLMTFSLYISSENLILQLQMNLIACWSMNKLECFFCCFSVPEIYLIIRFVWVVRARGIKSGLTFS